MKNLEPLQGRRFHPCEKATPGMLAAMDRFGDIDAGSEEEEEEKDEEDGLSFSDDNVSCLLASR